MIRSYFTIAFRSLQSHKLNTTINVLGLAVGIASAIIIFSIIRFELSFDQFHTHADRLYRIVRVSQVEGQEEYRTGVSYPLPPALREEVPSIKNITSIMYWGWAGVQVDVTDEKGVSQNKFQELSGFAFVEPSFFELFDFNDTGFKWIAGHPQTALREPNQVVLTRSVALKYFNHTQVVGKTIRIDKDWDCKVTGVIEDLPPNTDFPLTVMLSYSTLLNNIGDRRENWWSVSSNECYVLLQPGVTAEEVNTRIAEVHAAHTPKELHGYRKYVLQPLNEIHRDARFGNFNGRIVSSNRIWTLAIVGIFLLLTACINYINLATAQSALRSKEIGVRKVLGGGRTQLIAQFMGEAFLVSLMSGVIGYVLAQLAVGNFQALLSTPTNGLLNDAFTYKLLLTIIVLVTFLSGFYPSVVISAFNPLAAIKNKLTTSVGGFQLRKLLVVVQFTVTQIFIIGTFVVISQMEYFRTVDLGFDKEAIINVELQNNDRNRLDQLAGILRSDPAVSEISFSSSTPSGMKRPRSFWDIRAKEVDANNNLVFEFQSVDPDYLDLYGISLKAGRNFNSFDSLPYIIINETLATKAGYENADEAIGREMFISGDLMQVIGVMNDFHSKSLKEEVDKIGLIVKPEWYRMVSIKLNIAPGTSVQESITRLEKAWSVVFPEAVISYRFFDENIEAFYQEEAKFSKLMQIFSIILLFIGCLGLYGLISFVVNRRMKEVAVRKVFGATLLHIMMLITKDYVRLIALAFVIAAPITYYFLQQWLQSFVYHIEISWWIVVLPGVSVLLVALLAVSGQSLRAAHTNPAETLKSE